MPPPLVLASQSPRRRELLTQIGLQFEVEPADIDERTSLGRSASRLRLADGPRKSRDRCDTCQFSGTVVLGSDTSVVLGSTILGKPLDEDEAVKHLLALSDRTHQVMTAIAVAGAYQAERLVISDVTFKSLTEEECLAYCATGESMDKAGSYGIQGLGAVFVSHLAGSYSAVMGLPLFETAQLLGEAGIDVWGARRARLLQRSIPLTRRRFQCDFRLINTFQGPPATCYRGWLM